MFVNLAHCLAYSIPEPQTASAFSFLSSSTATQESITDSAQDTSYSEVTSEQSAFQFLSNPSSEPELQQEAPSDETSAFSFLSQQDTTSPEIQPEEQLLTEQPSSTPSVSVTPESPAPAQVTPSYDAISAVQDGGTFKPRKVAPTRPVKKKLAAVRPGHEREDSAEIPSPQATPHRPVAEHTPTPPVVVAKSKPAATPTTTTSTAASVVQEPATQKAKTPVSVSQQTPTPVKQATQPTSAGKSTVSLGFGEGALNLTGLKIRHSTSTQPVTSTSVTAAPVTTSSPSVKPIATTPPPVTTPTNTEKPKMGFGLTKAEAPVTTNTNTSSPTSLTTATEHPIPASKPQPIVTSIKSAPATTTTTQSSTATSPASTVSSPRVTQHKPAPRPLHKFQLDDRLSMSKFLDEILKRETDPSQQIPAVFAGSNGCAN